MKRLSCVIMVKNKLIFNHLFFILRLKQQKLEQAMNESRRRDEALGFWIPPVVFL